MNTNFGVGDSPEEFLRKLEEMTGRKFPVPPQQGPDDDCPICRALGMRNGPEEGVTRLNGVSVMTVVTGKPRRGRRRPR